jgi:hypothetical protein
VKANPARLSPAPRHDNGAARGEAIHEIFDRARSVFSGVARAYHEELLERLFAGGAARFSGRIVALLNHLIGAAGKPEKRDQQNSAANFS